MAKDEYNDRGRGKEKEQCAEFTTHGGPVIFQLHVIDQSIGLLTGPRSLIFNLRVCLINVASATINFCSLQRRIANDYARLPE